MPPKLRLQKSTGKVNTLTNTSGYSSDDDMPPVPALITPQQQQQFEVELCWCIQQLQNALKSGKLKENQVKDYTKSLNTLMSNSTPLIKKRQVMRLSFGDYRAKMAAEEKKCKGQTSKIKLTLVPPNKKSTFLKKSAFLTSGSNFCFNFETPTEEVAQDISNLNLDSKTIEPTPKVDSTLQSVPFAKSDNSFRFNFTCDNE